MTEIVHLSPFEQRVLMNEAPGGQPAILDIVIPSHVNLREPFSLKVAVLDAMGYPSVECGAKVHLVLEGADPPDVQVVFRASAPAIATSHQCEGYQARIRALCSGTRRAQWPEQCGPMRGSP